MIDFGRKKLYLLDMDGTLYLGNHLYPGTMNFLGAVRETGGRYLYLTNNSSRGVGAYISRLRGMGIEAVPEDFLTSTDALIVWLRKKGLADRHIYAFGTETFRGQLSDAGFSITTEFSDDVNLLVSAFDTELTFQKLEDSCRLLVRGVDWVATNPDWVCPTEWGCVPDCGSVSEMLTRATGKRPVFIGKPEPFMVELAMERCGRTKRETVVVGDRIYTDVACGVRAGVDSAFVLSGEGVPADIGKYGFSPSGMYRDVGEIADYIRKGICA